MKLYCPVIGIGIILLFVSVFSVGMFIAQEILDFRLIDEMKVNFNLNVIDYESDNAIQCEDGNDCTKEVLLNDYCYFLNEKNEKNCSNKCLKNQQGTCNNGNCEGDCPGTCRYVSECPKIEIYDVVNLWPQWGSTDSLYMETHCYYGKCVYYLHIKTNEMNTSFLNLKSFYINIIENVTFRNQTEPFFDASPDMLLEQIMRWTNSFNVTFGSFFEQFYEEFCFTFIEENQRDCLDARPKWLFIDLSVDLFEVQCVYWYKCFSDEWNNTKDMILRSYGY